MLAQAVTTGLILLLSSCLFRLISNYTAARKLGLPILITPLTWQDPVWVFLKPHMSFLRHLPFGLGSWYDYSDFGWQLTDRFAIHKRYGPAVVQVGFGRNEVLIADPKATEELVKDWKTWTKPIELYGLFDLFGKNLNSVNGHDWQRHKRITAPAFKEANCRLVWDESLRQATACGKVWSRTDETSLGKVNDDCHLLAMHVISAAGFGKSYDYATGLDVPKPGHEMSYAQSLRVILINIFATIVFKALAVPPSVLPAWLQELMGAMKEFKLSMKERVAEERAALTAGGRPRDDLLSALVRANEAAKLEKNTEERRMILSDDELYGNFFMFTFAGFETTATQVGYAFSLLAAYPDVQDWVAEEVCAVFKDGSQPTYDECFSKMPRTLSILFEILRLYGALQNHVKLNPGPLSQPLTIKDKTYMIPSNTYVTANYKGMHADPTTWGADVDDFCPSRWVSKDPTYTPAMTRRDSATSFTEEYKYAAGSEKLAGPPEGAGFFPWASGPRGCPGKKFAQVEVVAILGAVLKEWRVEPAVRGGESKEEARLRLKGVCEKNYFWLMPRMTEPEAAGIYMMRRSE